MAWEFPKNIPAFAKDWPEDEQRLAVKEANAAVMDGHSEGEAAFLALRNLGQSRQPQLMLEAARLAMIAATTMDVKEYMDIIGEAQIALELAAKEFDPARLSFDGETEDGKKAISDLAAYLDMLPEAEDLFAEVKEMVEYIDAELGEGYAEDGKADGEDGEWDDSEWSEEDDWDEGTEEEEDAAAAEKAATISNFLQGAIHREFTVNADGLYQEGIINRAERIALSNLIGTSLKTFNDGIDTDPRLEGVKSRTLDEDAPADDEPDLKALGLDEEIVAETVKMTNQDRPSVIKWLSGLFAKKGKKAPAEVPDAQPLPRAAAEEEDDEPDGDWQRSEIMAYLMEDEGMSKKDAAAEADRILGRKAADEEDDEPDGDESEGDEPEDEEPEDGEAETEKTEADEDATDAEPAADEEEVAPKKGDKPTFFTKDELEGKDKPAPKKDEKPDDESSVASKAQAILDAIERGDLEAAEKMFAAGGFDQIVTNFYELVDKGEIDL